MLDENAEQGIEPDVMGAQLESGMNNYQTGEVFETRTESPDGMRLRSVEPLLIMAPFAKAFNLTDDNLGVNEVPHVHSVPTIEEEILHVDADDSVNNDDGVQKQGVNEENGTDSPDEVIFINVPEEEGISDSHGDSTSTVSDVHMQQIKMKEILFPDVKADDGFTDAIGEGDHDEEGIEQIDIGVEIADKEGLRQKQPGLDAPGNRILDTNICSCLIQVKKTQKIN